MKLNFKCLKMSIKIYPPFIALCLMMWICSAHLKDHPVITRLVPLFIWFTVLAYSFDYVNSGLSHFAQVHHSHLHRIPSLHCYLYLYQCSVLWKAVLLLSTPLFMEDFVRSPLHTWVSCIPGKADMTIIGLWKLWGLFGEWRWRLVQKWQIRFVQSLQISSSESL